MATLSNQLSPMTEIVLTSPTNTLTQAMVSTPNAIYIIKNVFNLNGATIEIPSNCTLSFEGGALSNGTVKGNQTFIKALRYQIFDIAAGSQLILTGTFSNDYLSAHWFGAKGDGATDDAPAINYALNNSCMCTIQLDKLNYFIDSTIRFDIMGLSFKCLGTISAVKKNIVMIDITTQNNIIDINELAYKWNSSYVYFSGTAILLSDNVYHCNINVNFITCFEKGLSFIPNRVDGETRDMGSQYNKFTFQIIEAKYCVYIDLWSGDDFGNCLWMNENQFFGGRFIGKYGIYVERTSKRGTGEPKFDWINGNVFNSIGFEKIVTPVSMYHSTMNVFNDVRMSESITGKIWIDLLDCNNIKLNTKSFLDCSRVKSVKSCDIDISPMVSDAGLIFGYTKMSLSTAGYPFNSLMKGSEKDFKYLYRSESSLNMVKKYFFNMDTPVSERSLNFNDLFKWIEEKVDPGQVTPERSLILSNLCEITVYNNDVDIDIDLKDSIYRLRPDMTIRYNLHGNSKISFYMNKASGDPAVAVINQRGTYSVSTDENYNVYLIPLSLESDQI